MTRRSVAVASVIVLLLAGFGIAALAMTDLSPFYGSAPNEQPGIQANLVDAANRAGEGGSVKFADIVPGGWDTAYVWEGYGADRDHTAFPGVDFGRGAQGDDDVLAFANHGTLEAWVRLDINQSFIYFDLPAGGVKASRDVSVFTVTRDPSYAAGYVLRLAH
ncbi:MAG TPA: hypothetical protein VGQ85_07690 [Candidatus Limnocylindrales bacterium]|nr:hypothetical protein [Candidatus Limnocylindrales bacterium]